MDRGGIASGNGSPVDEQLQDNDWRKAQSLSFNEEGFFEFRKQHKTPDRRLGRGHKQAMVATRVQTDDRRGGEASKAVGFQPLATESRVHVTADFWFELNHGCSCV